MVMSWDNECEGPGPEGGRTVVNDLELVLGLVPEV
jgi:hypothetical protein